MIDYCDFMIGLTNAPFSSSKCKRCGGTGWVPVMCCDGSACGWHGMPVDFHSDCDCVDVPATDEQILAWRED